MVNITILILLRLRNNDSNWLAALFGFAAGCIVWFQDLFVVIFPALVFCFFVVKNCDRKTLWRQFGIALSAFTLAFLPVIPSCSSWSAPVRLTLSNFLRRRRTCSAYLRQGGSLSGYASPVSLPFSCTPQDGNAIRRTGWSHLIC